ncbi:hypothetical protein HF521_002411 [Silurus meridionalis]|uniref:Uncharacterized protein n=1 Tax=Silurus meridionalis TaxID=175797 RepID=A0A8T0B933_SILME|nr:hypothetical protein HF521_002411 [Silurus meridionalis]
MSLILVNLTLEDEGTYEEKTTLKNNTVIYFNFTLSLLDGSNTTISSTPGSLTTSKVQVTVTEVYLNSTSSPFFDHLKHPVFLAGSSLAGLLVLCFIFIYICKRSRRRNMKPPSTEEAIYNEVTFVQEEAIPLSVNPLMFWREYSFHNLHKQQVTPSPFQSCESAQRGHFSWLYALATASGWASGYRQPSYPAYDVHLPSCRDVDKSVLPCL